MGLPAGREAATTRRCSSGWTELESALLAPGVERWETTDGAGRSTASGGRTGRRTAVFNDRYDDFWHPLGESASPRRHEGRPSPNAAHPSR